MTVLSVVAISAAAIWLGTTSPPDFAQVRADHRPSDAWIVDRQGRPMESIRTARDRRSLGWVAWHEVSPAFRELLVQVEDQRFYRHFGVDPLAVGHAGWQMLRGHAHRGASTLSMQLTGLLSGTRSGKGKDNSRRDLGRKFTQMIEALKLDGSWQKDEILEAYVNLVPFRGELVGLPAASQGYFAKTPAGLFREEAALLIALIRAPNAKPELVGQRACRILERDDCAPVIELAQKSFARPYAIARKREVVPVLSERFVENGWGTNLIQTSLDLKMQELALHALREQMRFLRRQNVNDGAVLILETRTGRVVAYAANGGPGMASAPQVDGIQTRRQAGSTIKPIVYGLAYDLNLLAPDSLLDDSPADIAISMGRVYHPRNYDNVFRGPVSAGEALGSSMNVPAVRALKLVGETRVLDKMRELGFQDLEDDDYYGPSLALGAVDVTLWELTHAYRQFATENEIFKPETREMLYDSLGAPEYRRFTFGMDSLLSLPFPVAVKTGTSKDMRDNWCIGWTPEYTVGVWIGNFNGDPMWNVSGMSGAAPIWRDLMLALHPHPQPTRAPRYLPRAEALPRRGLSRIRYPAAGMLVGLDPEIPRGLQKLPIEIENPQPGYRLFLNRKPLSMARETVLWSLARGRHRLELKDRKGVAVDQVRFEVR
ncbi:MAG: transglycosylase domain-containing protein [Bdellovibrionaceae bacterium]|nr:transglycosylase domain-containing protein [Pseudobdellovibrionaceae bacterium]